MPRYLSAEWFESAQHALSENDARRGEGHDVELVVQQHVTAGPDGDVAYHVDMRSGDVRIASGVAAAPTVTFTQTWQTASAIGRGELSAQGAFMKGLIRIKGDLAKLIECSTAFGNVDDALAGLRSKTTY